MLILLAAAAGTGIVASDLLDLARLLLDRSVARSGSDDALGHALALDLGLRLDAGGEDAAHRLVLDGVDHILKHGQGLLLVDVHGVLVAVGLQADALTQLGHGVDVIHPVFVHHAQHHHALQLTHDGGGESLHKTVGQLVGGEA